MNKAIILQHVPYEGPGRLLPFFRDMGMPIEVRHLYRGDEVPDRATNLRALIVLGGPMGVGDIGKSEFPYLAKEVELLKQFIALDRPVLGICLGAQLLAHAGGAKVYPNLTPARGEQPGTPAPEFGWGPVTFPFPGGTDPIVFGLMDQAPMFHWHFDTFDLPRLAPPSNPAPPPAPPPQTGNLLISSTRTCKNQVFRFKNHLYGFQYHFEFTREQITGVLENASDAVRQAVGTDGLDRIRSETEQHYSLYSRLGERIVGNFVQFLKVY